MIIIISSRYFGSAIKSARDHSNISATQMAHLFGVNIGVLHRYENGTELIPRHVLRRVFAMAAMMDKTIKNI